MEGNKKVVVLGDSIARGVVLMGSRYTLLKEGVAEMCADMLHLSLQNYSKMGCTIEKGQQMLEQLMQRSVWNARNRSALTAEQLNGLDPYRKMKSGFAFLTDGQNKRIRSVSDTADGELIHLYLTDGRIDAVITHTVKKN